ncbi:MAG: hypothetical protein ABI812_03880 [Betaproteobacteria bacterium]
MKLNRQWLWAQLRANIVAITSMAVALTGLAYNTYRNEKTEINRNVRAAAFETLKNLGEVQIIVDYLHFRKDRVRGDTRLGWGRITLIHDLAQVLPPPGPVDADTLQGAWRDNVDQLEGDKDAMIKITDEIQRLRLTTLEILNGLR